MTSQFVCKTIYTQTTKQDQQAEFILVYEYNVHTFIKKKQSKRGNQFESQRACKHLEGGNPGGAVHHLIDGEKQIFINV